MIRMMQTEWINYFLQNVDFENFDYCKSAKTELLHWYFLEIINIDEKKLQKN